MNYPSLSLTQDLIDKVFLNKNHEIQKELKQTLSSESIRMKKYYKEQKELRLQNVVVEECDQCEYKTAKFLALYRHTREKHSVPKQKCTDCDYSHIYPNKVKSHYNQVHMGMKRKRRGLDRCRREFCEYAGTTNCLELQSHSRFFCEQCQLSFERSDSLKSHNDNIHEGLVYNCEYCDSYSTARKNDYKRHILAKHVDEDSKPTRAKSRGKRARLCKEEGCTYIDLNGELKRHVETKHEGIVRFKCHVMNCSFGSSLQKDSRRHTRTHEKESSRAFVKSEGKHKNAFVACDEEGCNAKVGNMGALQMHIAQSHGEGIKYICQLKNCNYETYLKRYLVKHVKRSKHQNSKSVTTTESVSADIKTPGIEESKSENVGGKFEKSLCSIPGCDFISNGVDETEIQDHFRIGHQDSELTENSFIVIKSAMAEALEILQEIQEIKGESKSLTNKG